jgi:hypothetical protein
MPTLEHNGLVEMFRENPSLAPHFLATLFHLDVPSYASVAVVESSLDQLIPVEFRADLVLELRGADGGLVLAIILEVQRDKDLDKKFSWPVYVAAVWAKKRCPSIVLVVAPDNDVAAWAAESIDLGLGFSTVRPLVLGPKIVPEVTDRALAQEEPERTATARTGSRWSKRLSVRSAASTRSTAPCTFRSSTMRCASPCGGPWRH